MTPNITTEDSANSPSSPEPAADCSAASSSDGSPSSSSSTTPTANAFSPPDSRTCPATPMCETYTPPPAPATSLPAASPASRSASLARGKARMTPATCGHTPFAYFEKAERRWASSRMCLDFLAQATSEPYSETWPKRGSMRSGACWEQTMLAPRIDASGCGSWPTVTAQDAKNDAGPSQWERNSDPLNVAVARGGATRQTWATPRSAMASMYPEYGKDWNKNRGGDSLATQAVPGDGTNGSLNPTWVEWLQGWPRGWTDCEHSVTDRCLRRWLRRSRTWLLK